MNLLLKRKIYLQIAKKKIIVKCDYCGKEYITTFAPYYKGKEICDKDCCSNKECTTKNHKNP